MIHQYYNLDLTPCKVPQLVSVSQYDDNSRTIHFNIYENGSLYSLTSLSAKIKIHIGENFNEYDCTVGSDISFVITSEMTAESGEFKAEVVLTNGGQITTNNFIFNVDSTPITVEDDSQRVLMNRALSIVLGRNVSVSNPQEAYDIIRG